MSGHSKWSTIKRKKELVDAKKGKIFTKLVADIVIAAKRGGGDPSANPSLRMAIDKAKAENMPKDNIQKAIDKGCGKLDGRIVEEITYEGYGPNGIAFLIYCLTDNKNRTVSNIRSIFNRCGGSLGSAGSVAYIFNGGIPSFKVPVSEADTPQLEKFVESLEELDDVVEVTNNADIL